MNGYVMSISKSVISRRHSVSHNLSTTNINFLLEFLQESAKRSSSILFPNCTLVVDKSPTHGTSHVKLARFSGHSGHFLSCLGGLGKVKWKKWREKASGGVQRGRSGEVKGDTT